MQSVTGHGNVMLRRLAVEADARASFVKEANKQWIWIAMDATSRQVIAFYVGDRSRRVPSACRRRFLTPPVSTPRFTPISMWSMKG